MGIRRAPMTVPVTALKFKDSFTLQIKSINRVSTYTVLSLTVSVDNIKSIAVS
jgi:hypothetical protein